MVLDKSLNGKKNAIKSFWGQILLTDDRFFVIVINFLK